MAKTKYHWAGDILRIHGKSANFRYVDGTPTPAKIQISHFLKVGQFYIDCLQYLKHLEVQYLSDRLEVSVF